MRYVMARYGEHQRELAYRIYVSDALKIIADNTARFGGGNQINERYWNIIHPAPEDNRTEEEVISHIRGRLAELR